MSAVRSRDTGPELRLRRALHACGCRFRVEYRKIAGRPDIAFPSQRVAVFVDGDFWHGNVAKARGFSEVAEDAEPYGRWANPDFWSKKIGQNVARDRRVDQELRELGWTVIRLWESELKADLESHVRRVMKSIGKPE
jgi:DNA mismatch endonuclease (patch repair protein)